MRAKALAILVASVFLLTLPGAFLITSSTHIPQVAGLSSGYANGNTASLNFSNVLNGIVHRSVSGNLPYSPHSVQNKEISHQGITPNSFSPSAYNSATVVFHEQGLPTNKTWFVNVNGNNYSGNGPSIVATLQLGVYQVIYGSSGYIPLSPVKTINVTSTLDSFFLGLTSDMKVQSTLFLSNFSSVHGYVAPQSSNSAPIGMVFDPANGYTYVADSGLSEVFVVNSNNKEVAALNTGTNPSELVYDPYNGLVYVTNSGSGTVSAINSENQIVATFNVGAFPFGITYDPVNHYVYVANTLSSNLSVIETSQSGAGSIGHSIQFSRGVDPFFALYDPSLNALLFTDFNGNNVIQVSGTQQTGLIQVKGSPTMMAYDSRNGNVYVTDSQNSAGTGMGYLSTISPEGFAVSNISLGNIANPFAVSFDSLRNLIYVSDANSNFIGVVNPENCQIIQYLPVGISPYGMLTGVHQGEVLVSNFGSGTITALNYTGVTAGVKFVETGLSYGTPWSVTLNGVTLSTSGNSISFNETPGSYIYHASSVSGYVLSGNNQTITVSGSNLTVGVEYNRQYTVTFVEHGLPASNAWLVNFDGTNFTSQDATISMEEPNGTYGASFFAADNASYAAHSARVIVSGSSVLVNVHFYPIYNLTISVHGLFPGTEWSVTINGSLYKSQSRSVSISLPNGSYQYSVHAVSGYRSKDLSGTAIILGSPVTVDTSFSKLYTVTFSGEGLSSGVNWEVSVNNSTLGPSSGILSIQVVNGTYNYTASPVTGYVMVDSNGKVIVNGANITVNIQYHKLYTVSLVEKGLVSGTVWSADIAGKELTSNTGAMYLNLTNGTYNYSASQVNGYWLGSTSGTISLNGSSVNIVFQYQKLYSIRVIEAGYSGKSNWSISLNGTVTGGSGSIIYLNETNGTYGFKVNPPSGYVSNVTYSNITVSGSPVTIYVKFLPIVNTTFTEVNVPSGKTWFLEINGSIFSTSGVSISLNLLGGNYSYSAYYIAGGERISLIGTAEVAGQFTNISLKFSGVYSITFRETGLESGATWAVNLSGMNITTSNDSVVFYLTNGTYNFTVFSSSNQSFEINVNYWNEGGDFVSGASPSFTAVGSGEPPITVNGGNITVGVHFNHASGTSHDHRGWNAGWQKFTEEFSRIISYVGEMIQYAVTNINFGPRFYFASAELMSSL